MLNRLKTAGAAFRATVAMPSSRTLEAIARVLRDEGYLHSYSVDLVKPVPILTCRYNQALLSASC
jgi:ribosomal protein S8